MKNDDDSTHCQHFLVFQFFTLVCPSGADGVVQVAVEVLQHGDRPTNTGTHEHTQMSAVISGNMSKSSPGHTDPSLFDVVLKEVSSKQLLVGLHTDGNDFIDQLEVEQKRYSNKRPTHDVTLVQCESQSIADKAQFYQ